MNYFTIAVLALIAFPVVGIFLYAYAFRRYRRDPYVRKWLRHEQQGKR
jgi:hypothetical protein